MNFETIICFGDSITIGSRSYMGYPEYCGNLLARRTNKHWNVINHATAGFTTVDLSRSVTNDFFNLKNSAPQIITIMIGTNDLKIDTCCTDFKIAYQQLLVKTKLLIRTTDMILLEIPDLREGVMLPYNIEMNTRKNEYNAIIRELGGKFNLQVKAFEVTTTDFYDGVHLNGAGSARWGEQLAEMIISKRFSTSTKTITNE